MIKWIAFILLIITTAGTFIPCCLVDECSEGEIALSTKKDNDKKEGSCSPFFACATCPGFSGMSNSLQLQEPVLQHQVHYASLVVINLSSFSSSFWQPPRIC